MRIQHNIAALNSYRNLRVNNDAVSKNLEKLSSGYKINRAGDDAAGLAISEKMRAQITGLETAQKNANDGISLVQTAEGALTEVHSMLNRMVELANQSANGTYADEVDRENLQKEITSLKEEIDRISEGTNYNGIKLLDGSLGDGSDLNSEGSFSLPTVGTVLGTNTVLHKDKGTATTGTEFSIDLHNVGFTNKAGETLTITIGDTEISLDGTDTSTTSVTELNGNALVTAIQNANSEVTINGQKFDVTVGSGGDARLTFTQQAVPADESEEVNGAMTVKIEGGIVANSAKATGGATAASAVAAVYEEELTTPLTGSTQATATVAGVTVTIDATAVTTATAQASAIATQLRGDAGLTNDWNITADGAKIVFTAKTAGAIGGTGPTAAPTGTTEKTKGKDAVEAADAKITFNKLVDYNVSTTNIENVTADNSERLASTYFNLKSNMVTNGSTITIGKTTYTFTTDEKYKDAGTTDKYVYVGDLDASKDLSKIAERLTDEAETNSTYTVGHDGSRITVTEIQNQTDFQKNGKSSLTTKEEIEKSLGFKSAGSAGKSLTLQIGDTSDDFNQLAVSVGSMSSEALGIGDVDISTQDGAKKAVDMIKTAINKVSSTRGDLGAIQNRLEHTINNLSVTAENMTAAESRIRDVDMAEEMMAYTKNNILVQASQAMLAQANQIPQGVLQLLQ